MSGAGSPEFNLDASALKVAVIHSSWHEPVMQGLVAGAKRALAETNCSQASFHSVPGAFELPLAAAKLAKTHDAVVALGVVIRGDTPHFDYVCNAATDGLLQVMLDSQTPIGFGLLTVDTEEQAMLRAQENGDNKGVESSYAALKMALDFK
jgi:6,7-dimethyl-8-ribityllumazine synthase